MVKSVKSLSTEGKNLDIKETVREELRDKVKELSQRKIAAICSEVGIGSCFW